MNPGRSPVRASGGSHDPLADEQDLLTLDEAVIRLEEELDELSLELRRFEEHGQSEAIQDVRRRMGIVEDAARRYRRLRDQARQPET